MLDYAAVLNVMQRRLVEASASHPGLFNIPGLSLACKIDPFYYLALYPGLRDFFAKRCGLAPGDSEDALIKTGELVTRAPDRAPSLRLTTVWKPRNAVVQRISLDFAFVRAGFFDHALTLYGESGPLAVSELKIAASERTKVERFLEGKTLVWGAAYMEGLPPG